MQLRVEHTESERAHTERARIYTFTVFRTHSPRSCFITGERDFGFVTDEATCVRATSMGCDDENNNLARRLSPLPSPGTHVTTPPQDGRMLAGRTSSRGVHSLVDSHQSSSASHSSTRIEPAPVVRPSQLPRIHYSAPRKSLWLVARGCHHILWERLFWSAG